jgi:hypothetical protein
MLGKEAHSGNDTDPAFLSLKRLKIKEKEKKMEVF